LKRVHVLVEGQTEETFVYKLLQPYLEKQGVFVTPVVATTKRGKSGRKFKGGVSGYAPIRRDLRHLLRDTVAAVTTMIDYYGLPRDFPGVAQLPRQASPAERVRHLEEALGNDLGDPRFLPYLSLHEFEALLLVSPEEIQEAVAIPRLAKELARGLASAQTPEEINDGPNTHPAARIQKAAPGYRKALHGPIIAERIGLDSMRSRCPHFDGWVRRLADLAS
jgi:Domain of unknown function (DUF4276)